MRFGWGLWCPRRDFVTPSEGVETQEPLGRASWEARKISPDFVDQCGIGVPLNLEPSRIFKIRPPSNPINRAQVASKATGWSANTILPNGRGVPFSGPFPSIARCHPRDEMDRNRCGKSDARPSAEYLRQVGIPLTQPATTSRFAAGLVPITPQDLEIGKHARASNLCWAAE